MFPLLYNNIYFILDFQKIYHNNLIMIKHKLMIFSIITNCIVAIIISAVSKEYFTLLAYILIIIMTIISNLLKITKLK